MRVINKVSLPILIIIVMILQSCSTFTKVFKKSDKNKEDIFTEISKEDNIEITDNSTIKIIEKVDTVIKTDSKNYNISTPIKELKDLNNLILFSDNLFEIKQNYDTLNKVLNTYLIKKPEVIKVYIDKTTYINKDIKELKSSKLDSVYNKKSVIKTSVKQKEPKNIFWYIILIIIGIISIIGISYLIKKYKSKFGILKIN